MTDSTTAPRIVLDTNVVLDWLLFDDPSARGAGAAIAAGDLRWIATAPMREEYFEVLQRPIWARWSPDPARDRAVWDAHCAIVGVPVGAAGNCAVLCADPDDQMFVDLAFGERADWLLSRDKALLALARRLRARGIRVATPAAWAADASS